MIKWDSNSSLLHEISIVFDPSDAPIAPLGKYFCTLHQSGAASRRDTSGAPGASHFWGKRPQRKFRFEEFGAAVSLFIFIFVLFVISVLTVQHLAVLTHYQIFQTLVSMFVFTHIAIVLRKWRICSCNILWIHFLIQGTIRRLLSFLLSRLKRRHTHDCAVIRNVDRRALLWLIVYFYWVVFLAFGNSLFDQSWGQ